MNLKFSIRARILLLAIVPILLMGGGSAFLARYEMRQYAEKEFEVNTRQELALFASFVRNILEEAQNNAALLARNPAVIAGEGRFPTFRHSSEDTEYTRDMLSPEARAIAEQFILLHETHKSYAEVFCAYPDGSYVTSLPRLTMKAGIDMSRRSWYTAGAISESDTALAGVYRNLAGYLAVPVTCKIKAASGELAGVAGIDVPLDFLSGLVERMKMGETGRFTLIEQSTGRVIVASVRPEFAGRILGEEVKSAGLEYLWRQPDGMRSVDLAGTPTRAISMTTDFGWKIIYLEDESELFAEVNRLVSIIFMFSLGISALIICVALLLTRSIVRPLEQLVGYARAVDAGNLDQTVDSRLFYGELEQLYKSLVRMLDSLKNSITEAKEQARSAREQEQLARQAMSEAEEARDMAENARRNGMHDAAGQIEGVVHTVSSASTQLAAQIAESDHNARETATRLTEAAAAINEMNATVQEVARNAAAAANLSVDTKNNAEKGEEIVQQSLESMQRVHKVSLELKEDMDQLSRHAQAINSVMTVISDIADQTNLLALNAAIEAARAGEAGRGFAVVADEVRKLAEKTMASTHDVGNAIRAIQESTAKSVASVDSAVQSITQTFEFSRESKQALEAIVSNAESSADQARAIAAASEEQSAASEEINRTIQQIDTVSAQISRTMDEAAQATSSLAEQAQKLDALVVKMKSA